MRNAAVIVALACLVSAAVASVVPEEHAAGNTTAVHAPDTKPVSDPLGPELVKTANEEKKVTELHSDKHIGSGSKRVHVKSKFFKSKEVKSKVVKARSKKIAKSEKEHEAPTRSKRGIIMPGFKCATQILVEGDTKICAPEGYDQFPLGSS